MNGRGVKIKEEPGEVGKEGQVHHAAGQTHRPRVSIRVATSSDSEGLRRMFSRSSTETIYLRFHIPYPEVQGWMVALMLDVDQHDGKSLVAAAEGEIVGHAMYARLGDGSEAEMAIVVEDGWQSKGVGKSLLSELARRARLQGIETFTGEVLRENQRMLGLVAMFARTRRTVEDGVYHLRMPLGKPDSISRAANPSSRRVGIGA